MSTHRYIHRAVVASTLVLAIALPSTVYAQAHSKHHYPSTPVVESKAARYIHSCLALGLVVNQEASGELICETSAQYISSHLPQCQEDEYLQGIGNYTHGHWSRYQCQHDGQ